MGGPARYLHYKQDEWFYAAEGCFRAEVSVGGPFANDPVLISVTLSPSSVL